MTKRRVELEGVDGRSDRGELGWEELMQDRLIGKECDTLGQ